MPKATVKTNKKVTALQRIIAIHRTFDKIKKGEPVFYVAEQGEKVQKLAGLKLDKFLNSITSNMRIRLTSQAYFNATIAALQQAGAIVESAHWHATGIAKGAKPEEIVTAFLNLSPLVMKPVTLREDLYRLRQMVSARAALLDYRKSATLRLKAVARNLGIADEDDKPSWLVSAEEELANMKKENERPVEKDIEKQAASITECVILKNILGVEGSWGTAASVVAYLGDPSRFSTVQAMWHYSGFHVVGGKAPKKAEGQPVTWSPKLRTALWLWADSMLKSKNPIWRPVYEKYKADEMPIHLEKHPDCKTIDGHVGARARRRVIKDVLKEFYLITHGEKVGGYHLKTETHQIVVAPKRLKKAA